MDLTESLPPPRAREDARPRRQWRERGCRRRLAAALVVCVSLAATSSWAQQRPVFETTVARIRVDVIVTDADGRFVEGLGPEDFVLLEDGRPQEILGVEFVDARAGGDGTVFAPPNARADLPAATGPPTGAPPAGAPRGALPVARPPSDPETPGVGPTVPANDPAANAGADAAAMVFLVDLPGMDWRNKERFASAWEELLAQTDALGMPRAVYMIDQVGRLHEVTPLTLDANALRAAAATVSAEPLNRKSQQERLADESSVDDPLAESIEERSRTRATLELLTQFCKALGGRGGRTSLVWITSEVQIAERGPRQALADALADSGPAGAGSMGEPSRINSGGTAASLLADTAILGLQQELSRAANSANVSIYTLDPTPVSELRGVGFDVETRTVAGSEALQSPLVQFALEGLRDALKSASADTGGKAFIHWMEPDAAIREIEADAGRFYLLTYANPEPIGDGRYHEIRLQVKGRDVNVRERSGYTDYPLDELEERALSGALNLPGTVGGAPLAARALHKWSATGEPILQIAVGTPARLAEEEVEFELHGLAVRADGSIEATLEQRVREAAGPLPVYVREWNLPAGAYDLHLVVRHPLSGELTATTLPVDVPEPTREWATSDVMLVVPDAAGRPIPLLGDELTEEQNVAAYVEVVFGDGPVISGELFDAAGSERIAALPPVALQRSGNGIFRGALRMTRIPAGTYVLQVAVTDAAAHAHRVLRLRLRVVAG